MIHRVALWSVIEEGLVQRPRRKSELQTKRKVDCSVSCRHQYRHYPVQVHLTRFQPPSLLLRYLPRHSR